MTAIEQLAAFLARLGREHVEAVQERLRLHVLDTMGAWIAGCGTAEGGALARFRASMAGRNDGSNQAGLLDDVARNCALARLSEVDDIHLASMTTPGAIVIPAALTIAAGSPHEPADLAAAILATQLVHEPITPNLIVGLVAVIAGIWTATTVHREAGTTS